MDNSTIAAIATPTGSGGIGIIKISGQDAIPIALSLFWHKGKIEAGNHSLSSTSYLKSHHLYYGHIIDPATKMKIDEVLITVMKAPNSYTKEDVVEIQAHAGYFVLKRILGLVIDKGAVLAKPGEFTKRAFINGRIDLTQAEAVIDIINARTQAALNSAASQIQGVLGKKIEIIREFLLNFLTILDALIDFPEDVADTINRQETINNIDINIINPLKALIDQYDNAHFLRDGLKLVIAGSPNVGKSSLMNRLINKERSIVTDIPGTTRDLIEDVFNLNGIPIVLTDTAGLHDTDDLIESIGIKKAKQYIDNADLVLFMIDANIGVAANDLLIFNQVKNKQLIIVLNKIDLINDKVDIALPQELLKFPKIKISALLEQGINDLKSLITDLFFKELPDIQSPVIPNLRHKNLVEKALESILVAKESLQNELPYELIAIDIQESIDALGEILGITAKLDILDNIFKDFCIGK